MTARRCCSSTGSEYGIADVKADQKTTEGVLALDRLTVRIDPRAEWKQEYIDAWRILRDWFYDPDLDGVDWKEMRDRYAELLPFVADRGDLDYVFGEIAGELGAGHVYVESPPRRSATRVEGGLLGADIRPDPSGCVPRREDLRAARTGTRTSARR